MRKISRIGAHAGTWSIIQGISAATVSQIGDILAVVGGRRVAMVGVAIGPVGPQEGIPDGSFLVRFPVRRVNGTRMRRRRRRDGGWVRNVVGERRHGSSVAF